MYTHTHIHKCIYSYDKQERLWKVKDLDSKNGVLYNGVRVREAALLEGDIVTFGGSKSTPFGAMPSTKAVRSRIYVYGYGYGCMCMHVG